MHPLSYQKSSHINRNRLSNSVNRKGEKESKVIKVSVANNMFVKLYARNTTLQML